MSTRVTSLLLLPWVMVVLAALILVPVMASTEVEEAPGGPVYVVRIEGAISPGTAGFLLHAMDTAVENNAQALIIEVDTPGGLAGSMRTMVKSILNAPIPVITFVSPAGAQAASAGVMITIAADVAAMAPGTNIGAAHPVGAGGKDIDGEMKKKVLNDMVAYVQSIAKERGRNAAWAKKAVERSISITASEAVQLNVVDLKAQDRQDLLKQLDGRQIKRGGLDVTLRTDGVQVVELEENFRDRILKTLSDPNIAYILMMLGLAGLYFELSHPGTILPGVVGGMCLILAFYSLQTLPVNYAGILLILLGIVLFILEIKVTSYGMLSIGGLASLTLGSLMLFKSPDQYMRVSMNVMVPVLVTVGGFFILVTGLVIKAHKKASPAGPSGLMGLEGKVKEWKDGRGKVLVHGEWWHASGETDLEPGEKIVVTAVDGMHLDVKRSDQD